MSHSKDRCLLTVDSVEAWLCKRLEAVRLDKNINQTELAQRAGVSRRTISRMENGQGISLETLIRVLRALGLEQNLAQLVPEVGIQPIERVREKRTKPRQRASRPRKPTEKKPWKWGDEPLEDQ